jgi:hypothetical protein
LILARQASRSHEPPGIGVEYQKALRQTSSMKVLSLDQAQACLMEFCEEALSGEIIRVQLPRGGVVQLTPVPALPSNAVSAADLAACYEDKDWAAFENHCAKASD